MEAINKMYYYVGFLRKNSKRKVLHIMLLLIRCFPLLEFVVKETDVNTVRQNYQSRDFIRIKKLTISDV